MKLGFVSAILPDLALADVVSFAATAGFSCVELMCWPRGKAERRYAGVTHVDVTDLTPADAETINQRMADHQVCISGLGYDPSHMIWQQMDYLNPLREFADRLFHVHAKDVRIDRERLNRVGILATPLAYHTPKLPGLGDVDWGRFFSVLSDTGYDGPVCVEVEDRAYEGPLERRQAALIQSRRFLENFMA